MARYIRITAPFDKAPTFVNVDHISYIIDKGHNACELVMSAGGDMNTGLPGAIRASMSAERFIEKYLGDWQP